MTYEEEKAVELLTSKNTDMQPLGLWLLVSLGWSPSAIAKAYVMWDNKKHYWHTLWNSTEYPLNSWCNGMILEDKTLKFFFDKDCWVQFHQDSTYFDDDSLFTQSVIYCFNGVITTEAVGRSNFFVRPVVLRFYFAKALRKYIQYVETSRE